MVPARSQSNYLVRAGAWSLSGGTPLNQEVLIRVSPSALALAQSQLVPYPSSTAQMLLINRASNESSAGADEAGIVLTR